MPASVIQSHPHSSLTREASRLFRARREGGLDRPFGEALGGVLDSYVRETWQRLALETDRAIDGLEERDAEITRQFVDRTRQMLRNVVPDGPEDADACRQLPDRIQEAAYLVGERIAAMWMAGQSEDHIRTTASALAELVQSAHLAGRVSQLSRARKVAPEHLAPAVLAATIADRLPETGAERVLDRQRLTEGAALSRTTLVSLAESLCDSLARGRRRILHIVRDYDAVAHRSFRPLTKDEFAEERQDLEALYGALDVGTEEVVREAIDLRTLTAFAASARGGSELGRIEGTLDLFRSVVGMVRIRSDDDGGRPSRYSVLSDTVTSLRRLSSVIEDERDAHRDVEKRWVEIDRELEMLQRRQQAPVYELPDRMHALEARALYLQDIIYQGLPLGVALAELNDSPHMTFGPSERALLERVGFYAARRYAADLAVEHDPALDTIAEENSIRAEGVRRVAGGIEIEMRAHEHLDDEALKRFGHERLREAAERGDLRRDDARRVAGTVDQMVTRIRAGQEVRHLTALLATDSEVPESVLHEYSELPHTRRFALTDSRDTRIYNMTARNGQPMHELERDTRARWMRYRQQAPAGVDVQRIQVGRGDADREDSPMRYSHGRALFRRKLSDISPGFGGNTNTSRGSTSRGDRSRGRDGGRERGLHQAR